MKLCARACSCIAFSMSVGVQPPSFFYPLSSFVESLLIYISLRIQLYDVSILLPIIEMNTLCFLISACLHVPSCILYREYVSILTLILIYVCIPAVSLFPSPAQPSFSVLLLSPLFHVSLALSFLRHARCFVLHELPYTYTLIRCHS